MFTNFFIKFRIPILFLLVLILVSAPVLANASSDTLPFDLWSAYRNLITFVDSQGVSHRIYVLENNVTRYGNSVIIDNAQPIMDDLDYPYFRAVSLDVPQENLSPRGYISDLYLNRPYSMTVHIYISSDQSSYVSLNNVSLDSARAFLYKNYSGSSYFRASISNLSYEKVNDDSFQVSFNATFTFDQPCYIYGFFFDIRGIFNFDIVGDPIDFYSFYSKFTLSDLILSDNLTKDDIEDSVSQGIIDGTGGNNYTAVDDSTVNNIQDQEDQIMENIEQYKDSSLSSADFDLDTKLDSSDLVGLKSTLLGLSNLVTNKFINKLPFSTVIYFAIGFGAFGFLFGLATWSVGTITKNNFMRSQRQAARSRIEAARSHSQARIRKGKGG